jgi:hypothetical protein
VIVVVAIVGGLAALAALAWPWLDPLSPARATERLIAVFGTWTGVRDFTAQVAVRGGEGETLAQVQFLAPGNLRVDVLAPAGLAGEVFALRPVAEGWLFVHHRPRLGLGIETRIPASDLERSLNLPTLAQVVEAIRGGQRVTYTPASPDHALPSDEFDVRGLPGQFSRIVLRVDPTTSLPRDVRLYTEPTGEAALTIEVRSLSVNTGLELRDLFRLEPHPDRWLRAVATPGA